MTYEGPGYCTEEFRTSAGKRLSEQQLKAARWTKLLSGEWQCFKHTLTGQLTYSAHDPSKWTVK